MLCEGFWCQAPTPRGGSALAGCVLMPHPRQFSKNLFLMVSMTCVAETRISLRQSIKCEIGPIYEYFIYNKSRVLILKMIKSLSIRLRPPESFSGCQLSWSPASEAASAMGCACLTSRPAHPGYRTPASFQREAGSWTIHRGWLWEGDAGQTREWIRWKKGARR